MIKLYLLLLYTLLLSESTFESAFITQFEYGKMLFNNPRGISCIKCHAKDAKGMVIEEFIHIKNKEKYHCVLQSKDITSISYKAFKNKLNPKFKEITKDKFNKDEICEKLLYGNTMPTYLLTDEEVRSIYFYLKNKK